MTEIIETCQDLRNERTKKMRKKGQSIDLATKQFQEGYKLLMNHPMFTPLASHAHFNRQEGNLCPEEGYAVVTKDGSIHVHPKKRATAEEWLYILAHCLLHLGFEHFKETENPALWNMACDVFVAKFLYDMKLGKIQVVIFRSGYDDP